ncbi:MAG: hypothetical protein H5U00_11505 [Clostridia bacterium]|nr:hypothetical protein [Clostridia bacterium]
MLLEAIDRDTSIEVAAREGRELAKYGREQLERLAKAYNELLTAAVDSFHSQMENIKTEFDLLVGKLGEHGGNGADHRTDFELALDELAEFARDIADQTAKVYLLAGYLAAKQE